MNNSSEQPDYVEKIWRAYMTTGGSDYERRHRKIFRLLPGYPRCNGCYAPFHGLGGRITQMVFNKYPSSMNPTLCNVCDNFAKEHQGGTEIELSLLFADIRGSTALAEKMSPREFSNLINRFYMAATRVLVRADALIDKIIGDQVAGIFVPGFAGPQHARRAIRAAEEILRVTGHFNAGKPWISLGAGVHTGIAFIGSVGSKDGTHDITVLGDAPNLAARLSSTASEGEILISEPAYTAAGLDWDNLEIRQLELKGKTKAVSVRVLSTDRPIVDRAK